MLAALLWTVPGREHRHVRLVYICERARRLGGAIDCTGVKPIYSYPL